MRAAKAVALADDSAEMAPMSEAPPSSTLDTSRAAGARVLVVDDDAEAREELRTMLTELGLVVEVVATASAASSCMAACAYDAIVLDYHVAGLEPVAFVRDLKRDPRGPLVPVLMLSKRPSSRDAIDAFASGADDFLPKPFRAPELGARIFGLLRRARLARSSSMAPEDGSPLSKGRSTR